MRSKTRDRKRLLPISEIAADLHKLTIPRAICGDSLYSD